jgi:hypothetical protein
MKLGANIANSGENVLNWISAWWFTMLSQFVKAAFITQSKSLITLAKNEDVTFFDLHVRFWKGKLYLSSGLFLFDKTLAEAVEAIKGNVGNRKIHYRIIYDDLLPSIIWKWKALKKVPVAVNKVIAYVKDIFNEEDAKYLTGVYLASDTHIGYTGIALNYITPPRVYHNDELNAFLEYLGTTPTGEKDIIEAFPNEVFDIKSGLHMPDPHLWNAEIRNWLTNNRADSNATYIVNYI